MSSFLDYSELPRILLEALVILSVSILIGLSFHYQLVRDVVTGQLTAPAISGNTQNAEAPKGYPEPVDLQTVQSLLAADTLMIDARIEELYVAGHIPRSQSRPFADIDIWLEDFLRQQPLTTPMITYCNGYGCPDSFDLAVRLLEKGYQKVMVFDGGYPEWHDAGLPIERGN